MTPSARAKKGFERGIALGYQKVGDGVHQLIDWLEALAHTFAAPRARTVLEHSRAAVP